MVEFLLAVLICLLVACTAAFGWPAQDSTFWTATAPAYMQGIGTIVAAVLAVMAYMTWRRPDIARRDSETAQLVMRASARLESAALHARKVHYLFPLSPDGTMFEANLAALKQCKDEMRQQDVDHLRSCYNEAETYTSEVRRIFDNEAAQLLKELVAACRSIDANYVALDSFIRTYSQYNDHALMHGMLDDALFVLGQLRAERGDMVPPEDGFAIMLKERGKVLRTHLSKWL